MAPTVLLIRHAEAIHNHSKPDPGLTENGFKTQCTELAIHLQTALPLAQSIDLIVTSPMRRTLQTTEQSLGWLIRRGVPVILLAMLQENSAKPCDTGTAISSMKEEWPQFNWDGVDPLYPSKTGLYEFSKEGITRRAIEVRKWLRDRPEKVIAVVSHSGFMRVGLSYRRYAHADFRAFRFSNGDEEIGGRLVELELTEGKGGLGKSLEGIVGWETQKFPDTVKTTEIEDTLVEDSISLE